MIKRLVTILLTLLILALMVGFEWIAVYHNVWISIFVASIGGLVGAAIIIWIAYSAALALVDLIWKNDNKP